MIFLITWPYNRLSDDNRPNPSDEEDHEIFMETVEKASKWALS